MRFSYGRKDKKLFLLLSFFFLGFEILALLKTIFFWPEGGHMQVPYELFILDYFIVMFFMFLIIHSTRKMLNNSISWTRIVICHFLLAVLVNTLSRSIIETYMFFYRGRSPSDFTVEYLFTRFMAYIDTNYLIYFVMVSIIYFYYYSQQMQFTINQKSILENNLLGTKLKLVNSQIQPHFLFNTLNTVVSLIKTNPNKAADTLVDLSEFLRGTLYLKEEQFIPVKKELNNLRKYCRILKTRFEENLQIQQKIDLDTLELLIPPFIIQPILENSIKHGFSEIHKTLEIEIVLKNKNSTHLEIEIYNNGAPLKKPSEAISRGIGLTSIVNRLDNLFQNDFAFMLDNCKTKTGVKSTIIIPLIRNN